MMSNLQKLMAISTKEISSEVSIDEASRCLAGLNLSSSRADDLAHLYALRNGFFAFESSLWVYGMNSNQRCSLEKINSMHELTPYREQINGGVLFAADAIGNQFLANTQGYWSFDMETGESEFLAKNLNEWVASVLADFDYITCFSLMHDWQAKNGPIKDGMRLGATQPFILGGEFSIDNLYAVDFLELIGFRSTLYQQVKALPHGAKVELKVMDD